LKQKTNYNIENPQKQQNNSEKKNNNKKSTKTTTTKTINKNRRLAFIETNDA
jgi:hypothetical protein